MKIICISGKAQHGKDTTAKLLKEKLERNGYSVLVTHNGDLVKYICKSFFNWDGKKDEAGRNMLQTVGTDVVRTKNPNYWVGFIASVLDFFPDKWDWVLIPDCRFPNEISCLTDLGFDVTHVRVVRDDFDSPLTYEQQNHSSETSLDGCVPDYLIHNNGNLDSLDMLAENLVVHLAGSCQMSLFDN